MELLSAMIRTDTNRWRWLLVTGVISVTASYSSAWAQDVARYTGPNLYKAYCASCHGISGAGDGPVASSLNVEVPDLSLSRIGRTSMACCYT